MILQNQEFYDLGDPLNDGANVFDGCIDSLVYGCPYSAFVEYDSFVNVLKVEHLLVKQLQLKDVQMNWHLIIISLQM